MYKIGDIIFVSRFSFSGGRPGNNHMFIIYNIPNSFNSTYQCFLISSNLQRLEFSYIESLKKDKLNSLHKDSVVYCNDFIKINRENILFKVGKVPIDEVIRFYDCFERNIVMNYLKNKQ